MASKIASGGFPGRQIEQIAFREASGTPQGRCLGNYLRIQNRSKPVTERFQDASNFEERFKGWGLEHLRGRF